MCVTEMSHRSPRLPADSSDEAESRILRDLMRIPGQLQGAVRPGRRRTPVRHGPHEPDEKNGVACYAETAARGPRRPSPRRRSTATCTIVASSARTSNFAYIPDWQLTWTFPENADPYVYICENETIQRRHLRTSCPTPRVTILVTDQTSMYSSPGPATLREYGLICAGVQKNVGPAGVAVAIIREDLAARRPAGV
ncbi:MAG: hypothetical protein ACLU9S_07895 [Oscillospiraceae bacterium]